MTVAGEPHAAAPDQAQPVLASTPQADEPHSTASSDNEHASPSTAINSNGRFTEPALTIVKRPAFGRAAGTAEKLDLIHIPEAASSSLSWILGGATLLVLIATVGAAFHLSSTKSASGQTVRAMTLGTKLTLSFGGLLVGLMTLSTIVARSEQSVSVKNTQLQESVQFAGVVNTLQQDMLMVRLNVKNFLIDNSDKSLQAYSNYSAGVAQCIKAANELAQTAEATDAIKQIGDMLETYQGKFNQTVALIDERNGIINSQINIAAPHAASLLQSVANGARKSGDSATAYAAAEADANFNQARILFFKYLRTHSSDESTKALKLADQVVNEVSALSPKSDDHQRAISEAMQAITFWKGRIEHAMQLQQRRDELVLEGLDKIGPAVATTGTKLVDALEKEKHAKAEESQKAMETAKLALTVITPILALLAIAVGVTMIRSITSGVSRVLGTLSAVANNDLRVKPINMRSNDEIGQLARATDTMAESLKGVITQVTRSSSQVAAAATQIAASSEEMARGMTQQSDQVTQISAAVQEMSASVVEVARKSSDAAEQAKSSGTAAEEGGAVVNDTIHSMQAINEAVSSGATSVSELGKRGEQIGEIIKVINDIAEQTNLLALNAAIEAARAGEHGRGFAVVADEVRKLAERTTKATEEVGQSIKSIQDETRIAVDRMETGTKQVNVGVEKASGAGASLQSIVASAKNVAGMIQSIAAAAEEQSAASEQISRSLEQISAVTKEATAGSTQAATAASELSAKAEELQALVSRFQLEGAASGRGA